MTAPSALMLVVPCYNEAARLDRSAFLSALDEMPWLSLLFVDDGSTDTTLAVLSELQDARPDRVDVLRLPRNQGKAEAVRQGLLRAQASAGDDTEACCGFWDADLSAALDELPALMRIFAQAPSVEWVWAIRLRALGRTVTRGAMRHYLGRAFATTSSLLLGFAAYDTQCGAKLFRMSPLLRTVIAQPFLSRWLFDVEMLSRAQSLNEGDPSRSIERIVYEQPLHAWQHRAGSKVGPTDFAKAVLELWRIRQSRRDFAARAGEMVDPATPVYRNDAFSAPQR